MRQCNKQTKPLFKKRFFYPENSEIGPDLYGSDDGADRSWNRRRGAKRHMPRGSPCISCGLAR